MPRLIHLWEETPSLWPQALQSRALPHALHKAAEGDHEELERLLTPSQPSGFGQRQREPAAFEELNPAVQKAIEQEVDKEAEDNQMTPGNPAEKLITREPHDTADAVGIYTGNKMYEMFGAKNLSLKSVYDTIDESRKLHHDIRVKLRKIEAARAPPDPGIAAEKATGLSTKTARSALLQLSETLQPARGGRPSAVLSAFLSSVPLAQQPMNLGAGGS
eukprot:gb/GFBE01077569.1/.p1 GENE.gb/GFBE01077569.1/~~gb/GFBE01077569.1/.p1  ORF type:complete len:218 (+),score=44.11 gb/GFBE01077569.1/:1-654(+)